MATENQNSYLSVTEAAEFLQVSARRVRQFISTGRLPATRLSSRFAIVAKRDLEQFKEQPRFSGKKGHLKK